MIARFFKEIGRVDELGSGVRNTYKYCGLYTQGTEPVFIEEDVFKAIIPLQTGQVTGQVTEEVQKIISALLGEMKLRELMEVLDLSHRESFMNNYLEPAVKSRYIQMKYPDSPNHPNQRYLLTEKGKQLKTKLSGR